MTRRVRKSLSRTGLVLLSCILLAFTLAGISGKGRTSANKDANGKTIVRLRDVLDNNGPSIESIDKRVERYMRTWEIRGVSLSIMRNDSLVYSKGYGIADKDEEMTPAHTLRMASVSKLVTAAGIMVLVDRGLLSLDDQVFGEEGILKGDEYKYCRKEFEKISVEHLLRHQAGFRLDPMFTAADVRATFGLSGAPEEKHIIELVLRNPLRFQSGTSQKYSNFGYLLLSKIIETVTGESYEDFIQENVLRPAGCFDFHLAHNYYNEKEDLETRNYTHSGDGQYVEDYHGNGKMVERSYGGNDIRMLGGAGAWCASTAELCRFVASIDGRPEVPDIISAESVAAMTEYIDESTFSLGWNDTNPAKGWNRTGTFSGTSALVEYFPDGECWVMITNTSTYRGPSQTRYTLALFNECRADKATLLPKVNLFEKKESI